MYVSEATLDDLLRVVLTKLLRVRSREKASRGSFAEVNGALLELRNPRARLSRTETRGKLFSCFGELLWYLSKSNALAFIEYYVPTAYARESEDSVTIFGGYGPRLFGMRGHDQIANVIRLLKAKSSSRRAVIQLFNAEDIAEPRVEIPCTCTLQFLIRENQLHLIANMRSNDAYLGLPHDVFAFTMLQEIVARSVGVEVGTYKHFAGSLHLYDVAREKAKRYLNEGLQSRLAMPAMPQGDPWPSLDALMAAEKSLRQGHPDNTELSGMPAYWADLVRLLRVYRCVKDKASGKVIDPIKAQLTVPYYGIYVEDRKRVLAREARPAATL